MLARVYLPGSAPSGACEQRPPSRVLREERAALGRLQGSGTARRGARHPDSPWDRVEETPGPARPALPSAVAARPAGGARSPPGPSPGLPSGPAAPGEQMAPPPPPLSSPQPAALPGLGSLARE